MRILHTSDWHLGQNFYSKSRAAEHQAFLDWLLETAQAHQVDAIIVAGDIFDTGSPPSYARELYNRFVVNLQQTGCHLVVLAGNHDSVATLNESRDILAFLNTTVIASAGYAPRLLHRRDGSPGAVLCPIPFLRPRDIITSQAGLSGSEKQQQLLHAIADYYQQQYREACQLRGERKLPVIATGQPPSVPAKAMRFATFISVRWMPFRRSISPPQIISHWDTFTARNVSVVQSISAIAARPSPSALMSAAKANACIW